MHQGGDEASAQALHARKHGTMQSDEGMNGMHFRAMVTKFVGIYILQFSLVLQ